MVGKKFYFLMYQWGVLRDWCCCECIIDVGNDGGGEEEKQLFLQQIWYYIIGMYVLNMRLYNNKIL